MEKKQSSPYEFTDSDPDTDPDAHKKFLLPPS